jgi:hypothetical protein
MTYILDDEWIKKFDEVDNLYKDFYKEDIHFINIRFIYLNKEKSISYINQESFLFSAPNKISKEEIIQLIKENIICYNKKYRLNSILKYNFFLDVEDIKPYLQSNQLNSDYLSTIGYIEDIHFKKTISMFQDMNEIIFIFHELLPNTNKINTKKNKIIYKTPPYTKPFHKKSIKKRFKG